jgi:nuclear transport factor 2 (NTF2) superfamily protein
MSKIQKISVTNFKAISDLEIDFKGCTAILTGGNNKGKSTFLRGVIDRIRGIKPELIVTNGKKEGSGTIELTTGEKFVWEFDIEGVDKLIFLTKEGYKTKVTKEIVARFFPPSFDIDKFLNSSPKDQSKQLQKIVGIDFTEIDNRYKLAYDDRTEKNREAERFHVKLSQMLECEKVDTVDLTELQAKKEVERTRLNDLYKKNKAANDLLRDKWNKEKEEINKEVSEFNSQQTENRLAYNRCYDAMGVLKADGFNSEELENFVKTKGKAILKDKVASELYPKEPEYVPEMPDDKELQVIDKQILEASETNTKAKAYADYIEYKRSTEAAAIEAKDADIKVKAIEEERENLIKSAKMPAGIAFALDGITVDGFPLDKSQISSSKLYCAALRIASMNIGEVETLHFDASFLDKNTLAEIENWASDNDLQLLIERADYDGDIRYELIEKK